MSVWITPQQELLYQSCRSLRVASGSVWRGAQILAHIRFTTLSPTAHNHCTNCATPAAYLMQCTTNTTTSFAILCYYVHIIATAPQSNVIEREKTAGFVIKCGHTPLQSPSFKMFLYVYIYMCVCVWVCVGGWMGVCVWHTSP